MFVRQSLLLVILLVACALPTSGVAQAPREGRAKRHFDRARDLDSLNDAKAEQEYKAAIKARGGHYPEASLQLSFYLGRKGRFSEAAELLQNYIYETPKSNHHADAEEIAELRRTAELQERIQKSEKPDLKDLLDFASLVVRYQRVKDGVPSAERAVDLYPDSSEAHVVLARLLIGSGQEQRRYELLRRAIELDPKSARAHHQLGWYHIETLRSKEAVDEFRNALELSNAQLSDAWQGLGWALSGLGQNKEAINAFRNYLHSGDVPEQYRIKVKQQIEKLEGKAHR